MRLALPLIALTSATTFLSACDNGNPAGPADLVPAPVPVLTSGGGLVPLDQFGIGIRGPGVQGCRSDEFHHFDFWAGNWDVVNPAGGLAGTNIVTPEVDGCVLVENWTGSGGGQGKSLNSFDAVTGMRHQMWVTDNGCPFGVILMAGGLVEGRILLTGRREQPLGFLIAPPCGPPPPIVVTAHTDRFRWSVIDNGQVLQQIVSSNNDAPLPPLSDPATLQGLRYLPVQVVTPIPVPPQPPSFCPFRAAAHHFDFMQGTWRVHRGSGEGAPATATIVKTMGTCLVEERIVGPGGYRGISFSTFDVFTQRWTRTFADNAGQWLLLTGGLQDGKMVLEGTRPTADGREALVRVVWDPVASGHVDQRWSVSLDGGETWQGEKEVHFQATSGT